MDIRNAGFPSIEQVQGQYLESIKDNKTVKSEASFDDILSAKFSESNRSEGVRFSKHAAQRLSDRNINLTEEQLDRLNRGAQLSGEKGIKESLVLMDKYAFIVNTGNSTVITAMEQDDQGENVYTNIDGAVLV